MKNLKHIRYYFNGRGATVDNYTDPSQFIKLDKLFHKIRCRLDDVNNIYL